MILVALLRVFTQHTMKEGGATVILEVNEPWHLWPVKTIHHPYFNACLRQELNSSFTFWHCPKK